MFLLVYFGFSVTDRLFDVGGCFKYKLKEKLVFLCRCKFLTLGDRQCCVFMSVCEILRLGVY